MRPLSLLLPLLLLIIAPAFAQSDRQKGQANKGAPEGYDPNEVVVKIDGEQLDIQHEYELEKDQTYKLEVENLEPNSNVEVVVKFMGLFGVKKETEVVPESGKYWRLFDTPRRRGGASATVTYVTTDGQVRTKVFKLKVR